MTENHYHQQVFTRILLGGMLFILGVVTGVVGLVALQWTVPAASLPPPEVELEVIEFPNSNPRPLTASPQEVFVGIDAAGKLSLDGIPRTQGEVKETLSERAQASPGLSVIIRVDKRADFQHVAELMKLCDELRIFDRHIAATDSVD